MSKGRPPRRFFPLHLKYIQSNPISDYHAAFRVCVLSGAFIGATMRCDSSPLIGARCFDSAPLPAPVNRAAIGYRHHHRRPAAAAAGRSQRDQGRSRYRISQCDLGARFSPSGLPVTGRGRPSPPAVLKAAPGVTGRCRLRPRARRAQ